MRMFIWNSLEAMTDSYHDTAGVCVVAASRESAKVMIEEARAVACESSEDHNYEPQTIVSDPEPDAEYELSEVEEPRIFIFPNAGCC